MKKIHPIYKTILLIPAFWLSIFTPSCNTEVGNPDPMPPQSLQRSSVSLSIQGTTPGSVLRNTAVSLDVLDINGTKIGTLDLTDARLALKEIRFDLAAEELENESEENRIQKETQNNSIEFQGPYIVDLLQNTIKPNIKATSLITGVYKQIEIKLAKLSGTEKMEDGITPLVTANDSLFNRSIFLAGTYTGMTAAGEKKAIPFALSFDMDESIELTGIGSTSVGFSVLENLQNSVIIAFRLNKWFNFQLNEAESGPLDFSKVTPSFDSTKNEIILLDENAANDNASIRSLIKDKIEKSADYGKDEDGDGKLSKSEDDDPDTEDSHDY